MLQLQKEKQQTTLPDKPDQLKTRIEYTDETSFRGSWHTKHITKTHTGADMQQREKWRWRICACRCIKYKFADNDNYTL